MHLFNWRIFLAYNNLFATIYWTEKNTKSHWVELNNQNDPEVNTSYTILRQHPSTIINGKRVGSSQVKYMHNNNNGNYGNSNANDHIGQNMDDSSSSIRDGKFEVGVVWSILKK